MKIDDELWEKIKEAICDDYCFWATMSSETALEQHCENCPLQWPDKGMTYDHTRNNRSINH